MDARELEEDMVRVTLRAIVCLVLACQAAVSTVEARGTLRLTEKDSTVRASVEALVACLVEIEAVLAAQAVTGICGCACLASWVARVTLAALLN